MLLGGSQFGGKQTCMQNVVSDASPQIAAKNKYFEGVKNRIATNSHASQQKIFF